MIQHIFSKQFLGFLLTGGIAASVNIGTRLVYNQWMSFSSSVILAYITGMFAAFFLAKLFVFKNSTHKTSRSAFYFTLVNIVALAQTWTVSIALAQMIDQTIAHFIGTLVPVFSSYFGHKYYSFR